MFRHVFFKLSFMLSFCVVFLLCSTTWAETLRINKSFEHNSFEGCVRFFIDDTNHLSINDVSKETFNDKFYTLSSGKWSFGYNRSTLWLTFTVENPDESPVDWILEYFYMHIDYLTLYVPSQGSFTVYETGDMYKFNQRPVNYRTFIFPISTPAGRHTYYMKIKTSGIQTVSMSAWSEAAFRKISRHKTIFFWILLGISLGLFIYNIIFYISIGSRSILYMSFMILSFILTTYIKIGFAFQYLWPDSPVFANYVHPFSMLLSSFLCLLFVREYLNIPKLIKEINKPYTVIMAAYVITMLSSFILDYYYFNLIAGILSFVLFGILLITGILALRKKLNMAVYNFLSMMLFLIIISYYILHAYAVVPNNMAFIVIPHLLSVVMVLVLIYGITNKIKYMQKEKEQALMSLKKADDKYQTLVEHAREGIMMLVDEQVVYANKSITRITGFEREYFSGINIYDLFPDTPIGKELVKKRFSLWRDGKTVPSQFEAQMFTREKDILDVIVSTAVIPYGDGEGLVVTITDITELKRAHDIIARQFHEIQLQCEEVDKINRQLTDAHEDMSMANEKLSWETDKLSITLKSIGEGVITLDPSGVIELMNSAAERIIGYRHEEAEGRHVSEVLFMRKEYSSDYFDLNSIVFNEGATGNFDRDVVIIDRNKNLKYVLPVISQIRNSRSEIIGAILVLNDITQRKKMEEEIIKTSKIESLGVFAGGIAHDFNNLLTAIAGNLSLVMLDMDIDEKNYKFLADAEKVISRASDLTRQLLTFSRGGAPVKKAASVSELLQETADFVLSGSNVKAEFIISQDLWNSEIDAGQISQVIQNLILNATQAMPEGGTIIIKAENIKSYEQEVLNFQLKDYIKISITDTGTGISQEHLDKIFDPFFTTKPKGNGLGLSICYSIVKKHEGYLTVESEKNRGSTFYIYLPATSLSVVNPQTEKDQQLFQGKVLFMDDEKIVQDVGVRMLQRLGFSADVASHGEEAVEKYRAARLEGDPYNFIIMDLTIPGGMGGKETISVIKDFDPDVKAIASSGYSNDPVMANYRDYGFIAVIGKPYKLQELSDLMKSLIVPGDN